MRQSQIDVLARQLKLSTGLDFKEYQNDELAITIGSMMLLPRYIGRAMWQPILAVTLPVILLIVLLLWQSRWPMAVFVAVFGGILAVLNGTMLGLLSLFAHLKEDLARIIELLAKTAHRILHDLEKLSLHTSAKLPRLQDIISGVLFIIIVPSVKSVLEKKVPLLGDVATWLISRLVGVLHTYLLKPPPSAQQQPIATVPVPENTAPSQYFEQGHAYIDSISQQLGSVQDKLLNTATFPVKILWALVLMLSALVIMVFMIFW